MCIARSKLSVFSKRDFSGKKTIPYSQTEFFDYTGAMLYEQSFISFQSGRLVSNKYTSLTPETRSQLKLLASLSEKKLVKLTELEKP